MEHDSSSEEEFIYHAPGVLTQATGDRRPSPPPSPTCHHNSSSSAEEPPSLTSYGAIQETHGAVSPMLRQDPLPALAAHLRPCRGPQDMAPPRPCPLIYAGRVVQKNQTKICVFPL